MPLTDPVDRPDVESGGRRTCAVCGHTLVSWSDTGWEHALGRDFDHLPVPVREGEMAPTLVCDFCAAEQVTGYIPAPTLTITGGHRAHDGWTACPVCLRLWRRGRVDRLIDRVLTSLPRVLAPAERRALAAHLADTYARLAAVAGEPRPMP